MLLDLEYSKPISHLYFTLQKAAHISYCIVPFSILNIKDYPVGIFYTKAGELFISRI